VGGPRDNCGLITSESQERNTKRVIPGQHQAHFRVTGGLFRRFSQLSPCARSGYICRMPWMFRLTPSKPQPRALGSGDWLTRPTRLAATGRKRTHLDVQDRDKCEPLYSCTCSSVVLLSLGGSPLLEREQGNLDEPIAGVLRKKLFVVSNFVRFAGT